MPNAIVLGRKIGTFVDLDQSSEMVFIFHNFQSNVPGLPTGDLVVDFDEGEFQVFSDDGKCIFSADMLSILQNIPKE